MFHEIPDLTVLYVCIIYISNSRVKKQLNKETAINEIVLNLSLKVFICLMAYVLECTKKKKKKKNTHTHKNKQTNKKKKKTTKKKKKKTNKAINTDPSPPKAGDTLYLSYILGHPYSFPYLS